MTTPLQRELAKPQQEQHHLLPRPPRQLLLEALRRVQPTLLATRRPVTEVQVLRLPEHLPPRVLAQSTPLLEDLEAEPLLKDVGLLWQRKKDV